MRVGHVQSRGSKKRKLSKNRKLNENRVFINFADRPIGEFIFFLEIGEYTICIIDLGDEHL